jgi:hypothetical protein
MTTQFSSDPYRVDVPQEGATAPLSPPETNARLTPPEAGAGPTPPEADVRLAPPAHPPLPVTSTLPAELPRIDPPLPLTDPLPTPTQVEQVAQVAQVEQPEQVEPVEDYAPYEGTEPEADAYAGSVEALVHTAVIERPLEEVARLIELLEQSPQHTNAAMDALRGVGANRSVEDVTQLASLLTQPPRDPESADEAIRAAAERRPVEEVTRLLALLRGPSLPSHCAQEAVRVAATGRPVEDLVHLIRQLHEEEGPGPAPLFAAALTPETAAETDFFAGHGALPVAPKEQAPAVGSAPAPEVKSPKSPKRNTPSPVWARWTAVAVLLLCALAYFPFQRDGASAQAYGIALGASWLCVFLALVLSLRVSPALVAASMAIPVVLTVAQVLQDQLDSRTLTRALEITAAPSWLAGLAAIAALAALTLLLALMSASARARRPRDDVNPTD